jgi:hypothetical protein
MALNVALETLAGKRFGGLQFGPYRVQNMKEPRLQPGSKATGFRPTTPEEVSPMTVAVISHDRALDAASWLPTPCMTCAPSRGSSATHVIEFDRIVGGELEGDRWFVCRACVGSAVDAVDVQHQGFTPPILSRLPVASLSAVAA